MLKKLIILLYLLVIPLSYGQQCQSQLIEASYTISQQDYITNSSKQKRLGFYRNHREVSYAYGNSNIKDVFYQVTEQQMMLTRYFSLAKRGIEYQPNELKEGQTWQAKNSIILPATLATMEKLTSRGKDCLEEIDYKRVKDGVEIKLTWLPQLQLPKHYQIKTGTESTVWQLTQLNHDQKSIQDFFLQFNHYKTTDYTDIGDNEDDPFFAQMINQGFIEHRGQEFDGHQH